ncbi:glycosyltransferase family 4 protein [Paraburkholderia saeva]|uniref:D-inositol-3-phosphate glycosyltransferase n=1 Tax=Paraburkholderia saeva TaxID=2777537 RepID=A0A9N8RYE1_9BURK|nr:glycosyltransferase family 4 protein [Paraburkholderia saeva]CAG4891395.1 D-inositol-3-phosphate glycosyltransferase [Paraburkholderia saeva]CAG4895862.1 D-inositol-3-phosphate glycosyltransferase [Paraburkholderia saeva]CAG4902944.1 D-inositol-3-phosphate glycosyltransferase [Paraburkholderia saeva]
MKILLVTHRVSTNDGQGRVNYEIVRALLAAGHSVTVLGSRIEPALLENPLLRFVQIRESYLPTRLVKYQIFALRSGAWIAAHRREFDLIHVNGFITWARADVNSVHFVHDGWYRCGFYPIRLRQGASAAYQLAFTRLNMWCEKRAFRAARTVVPVSQKVATEVRATGIDARNLHMIHNGVDVEEFAPGPTHRERFGLPSAPFLLLFAGDLRVARKNLDAVLRALVSTPAHVHLVVAGGVGNCPYPALASTLGIAGRVHFIDFVQDMPALMRSVDAFVFPSRYEAMSLVMLEALASALPVVTVATAGGAEVIDSACGVVLDSPEDIAGLAAAISWLAADPERARTMGMAARRLATSLSWEQMAMRYLSLYDDLIEARAPGASGTTRDTVSAAS